MSHYTRRTSAYWQSDNSLPLLMVTVHVNGLRGTFKKPFNMNQFAGTLF